MKDLVQWMKELSGHQFVTLFETDEKLVVKTKEVRWRQTLTRTVLTRTKEMEDAIWRVVDHGLNDLNRSQWQGLFYVMGKGQLPDFFPLYIGTVAKSGRTRPINTDFNRSHLAHWGDGLQYHIGDLSNAIFASDPSNIQHNFKRWAEELFVSIETLQLKEPVYLYIAPWWENSENPSGKRCTIRELREEFVDSAGAKLRLVGRKR